MREPDRTYTTLFDRAEYILADQIDEINYWYKASQKAKDPDLRERNHKRVMRELAMFSGMQELFDATFRDYTIRTELIETEDGEIYRYWIEAR